MRACTTTVYCQLVSTQWEDTYCTYQNPYIEQQFPKGQFPQTVLPFEAPQVPSVVVALGFGGVVPVTGPIMGSEPAVVAAAPLLQPFWQPWPQ